MRVLLLLGLLTMTAACESAREALRGEQDETCRRRCGTACGPDRIWYTAPECVYLCAADGGGTASCD